ncbi:MAG: biotin/lipoyl-containing protein, partial [Saprospiraceae bacterium]
MAQVELIMPKMGESIMEATILRWVKNVGDTVEADETILEIATDKVDSEVPSPATGVLSEIKYQVDDVVPIGEVIAVIATEGEEPAPTPSPAVQETEEPATNGQTNSVTSDSTSKEPALAGVAETTPVEAPSTSGSGRFYSPLVRNIAKKE